MAQPMRGEALGRRAAFQLEQVGEPVADAALVHAAAALVANSADPLPKRGRTSLTYQRNTRSSWSSIGTQRGLGPEPLAALP
jgi:hypothetical protein